MAKAVPVPNAETRPFWEACARGELLYQFCAVCACAQFYPRAHCARCQGKSLEWRRSTGEGAVYSHTTVHRAPTPAFKELVPYVIALVDLDEGFRMMMNVLDCDPGRVAIGSRVRVVFRESAGATLPQAVPA